MKKKWISLITASVMALGLMTGCGNETEKSTTKTESGTLTMAINYMPASFQPSAASDDQVIVDRPIFDQLFVDTKDGMDYYLAEKLDISEDGKTYTIHLNPDANWSDGTPVTVTDVLFTINYSGLNTKGVSSYNTLNGQPIQFNEIDEKTLEIILPETYNIYAATLGRMTVLPAHAFDNDPEKVDESGYFNSKDMATSGAYTISEINNDSIVYERREDYYRGTPSVEKIIMKTIGSGSTKQVAFENGEISYMRITTKEELEKYEQEPDKYNVYSIPESRLNYLQVNPYGPMKDQLSEEARKALFLALNPQEIVDAAYGTKELAVPANSLLTPEQVLYDPDCKGYEQNLEEAKKLAKSSGLEGETLVYIYNADRPNMEAVATVIQQQLAEIGVNLSIEGLDSPTFFNRFFGVAFGTGEETTWDLGTNGWDSQQGSNLGQAYRYFNATPRAWGFSDEVAQLTIDVNAQADLETAKEKAKGLQEAVLAEYYEYPLTYTNYIMVSQKNVKGLDAKPVVPEFVDYLPIEVE